MSRNVSVSTLLVVAVVGLGLMGFIGFRDGASGAVQVGGGASPSVSYPSQTDSYYYQQGGATASDWASIKMLAANNVELNCEIAKSLHASGHPVTQRAHEICAMYGEPIIQ